MKPVGFEYCRPDTLDEALLLLEEFGAAGGEAMEVVTGSHSPDQYALFAEVAHSRGLLASRGSDFHAPGEANADFGKLPPLPARLTPVWHDWPL